MIQLRVNAAHGAPSPSPPWLQDTEFPGVVARPIGSFSSHTDYHYQTLRCNVDLLKIIQLGITFANDRGELADDCPTWQFNFKFNLQCVMRRESAALSSQRQEQSVR